MSDSQNVQVSFTSDTGNLDAGTQAAARSVETAAAEITTSLEEMGGAGTAAMEEMTTAVAGASEKTTGLLAGISERVKLTGESFETLHARLSVFSDAAGAFSEFLLAGLALDQVKEAVLGVAETGEQMLHLSQATGIATEQLSGIKLATQEAGGNFDTFQQSILRLANNMETAVRTPTSASAEAFKTLGISVTDANGQLKPTTEILDEVGNKLSDYADGTDKAAIEMSLFGIRGAALIPVLNQLQGDGGIAGATAKIQAMGGALSEAAAEADERFLISIHDATAAVVALGSDIIQGIIPALTTLGAGITTGGSATDIMGIALNTLETILKGVIGTFSLVESIVADVILVFSTLGNEIGDIIDMSRALTLALEGNFHEAAQLVTSDASDMATNYENAVNGMEKNTDSFINTLHALQSTAGNVSDTMQNLQSHQGAGDTGPALPQAPTMDTSASNAAAKKSAANQVQIAQDQANEEQQIAATRYAGQVDIWDAEVTDNKITKSQEISDEITAADEKYATDLDAAQKKVALYQQGTAAYQKALDDELLIEAQHNDAILKLDAQLAQAQADEAKKAAEIQKQYLDGITKDFESAFRPIDQAFSSTISGIIQGTETLRQGVDKALQSILLSVIDDTEKMLTRWAAMELGKLTATANSQAGIEAINAQGKAVQAATDIEQIENAAAVAAAKAYSAVAGIPYIGPFLAPAAAAAAFAGVMAFDVISAAGGAGNIESDGTLGILHANEMVLPASIATPLRANLANAGGVGGGSTAQSNTLHFSPTINGGGAGTMTPAALNGMLNSFSNQMFGTFENWFSNNGSLMLPGRGN